MHRIAFVLWAAFSLVFAPDLAAQKKPKDEALHQYLIDEFAQLNAKVGQLAERLTALEAHLGQLKQQQQDLSTELRNSQNTLKTVDTSLNSFRLGSQQDLFGMKTDLAQVRQELFGLADVIKKSSVLTAKSPEPPPPTSVALEGYITGVEENEITINLGSNAGVKVGARFNVYRASDPRTQIGAVEVTQVIDANNSRAKVILSKPDTRFEFSDIVRLM